jgi:hypothetical protein
LASPHAQPIARGSKSPIDSRGPGFEEAQPYPALKTTELVFRDNNNFAIGFSTNQSENFQGYHGKQVLIIADEAPGIESGIWDAIAGTMAAGKVHIIMAGNPTMPSGAFFDAFTRERALWHCIGIDAFDSPNLKGLTLEKLLQLDPARAVRSIKTRFLTLPPSAGYTINILCGGTGMNAVRPTGCRVSEPSFPNRHKMR